MIPSCTFAANPQLKAPCKAASVRPQTKGQPKTLEQEQIFSKTCHFSIYEAEKQQFMFVSRPKTNCKIASRMKQKWGWGFSCGTGSYTLPCAGYLPCSHLVMNTTDSGLSGIKLKCSHFIVERALCLPKEEICFIYFQLRSHGRILCHPNQSVWTGSN